MAKNQLDGVATFAASRPDLFAESYFSALIVSGEKPDHGYPTNHLPEISPNAEIEMVLGFRP